MPAKETSYIPRRDIITNGWIEPNNSQIELFARTFDDDDNITNLTMRYKLVCLMKDVTTEYKLIDEFDMMPYKITSGVIDGMNQFLFNKSDNFNTSDTQGKRYYVSDLQPNYKNMFKMTIRIKNVRSSQSGLNNESLLEILTYHTQMKKPINDDMIANM